MVRSSDAPALVIVGASARAMATSAVRAGFRVFTADLFGDHDLREFADGVATISPYPKGVHDAVAGFPVAPVLYTGAFENFPSVIEELAMTRPLVAASSRSLARARSPDALASALGDAGLFFPETLTGRSGVPVDGSWLAKPRASAGGHGITPWFGATTDDTPTLWQKRIAGRRFSVAFALRQRQHEVLALSRQLIGCRWCNGSSFAYCGSVDHDPQAVDSRVRDQLARLGEVLATVFDLEGLVGADLILDASWQLWVIEINPRPTASMELVERATGVSLAARHVATFGITSPVTPPQWPRHGTWAKAILFANDDVTFDEAILTAVTERAAHWTMSDGWPAVADIPQPPCPIPRGAPVCSVFAHDRSPRESLAKLRHRVAAVEAELRP